jgi:hypothetical protein
MADGHGGNATKDGGRHFAFPPLLHGAFTLVSSTKKEDFDSIQGLVKEPYDRGTI